MRLKDEDGESIGGPNKFVETRPASQKVVTSQPKDSVLVLSDFRDTSVGSDLLSSMNAASAATKSYVRRTAVLGVTEMKRKLADLLTALTGQPLKYFDDIESAKDWLAEE